MRIISATVKALTCALFILSLSASAHAVSRTWVSGVGNDGNPCSRTAPCKTFAGAMSKTDSGGEISVMDAGGYGSVIVSKSVTIDGGGFNASILYSNVTGVTVNDSFTATPNTIVVTLRRITMNGFGSGTNGVHFVAGKTLNIEDCQIFGSNTAAAAPNGAGIRVGLSVSGSNLNVKNTSIFKNRIGITATTSAAGNVTLNINNCHIENNTSDGIFLDARAQATVRNTNSSFNGGAGVSLNNNAGNSATIEDSELNHNALVGLFVGTGTTVRLGRSLISQNGANLNFSNNGTIITFCNNDTETATIPGSVTQQCQK
ncbi:MAG TPA: right-handed parallel beta-helix repeat-containing protein [Pyrinomonadaceae bacterium]|nr:right-handed parallel beta-helix repeat-containing protein [Pyrinomonadaceae bacterium]